MFTTTLFNDCTEKKQNSDQANTKKNNISKNNNEKKCAKNQALNYQETKIQKMMVSISAVYFHSVFFLHSTLFLHFSLIWQK